MAVHARPSIFARILLFALVLIAGLASSGKLAAQTAASEATQVEKVQRFLDLAEDPQVRAWLLERSRPTTSDVVAEKPVEFAAFTDALRARFAVLLEGVRAFPSETVSAVARLQAELDAENGARPILVVVGFLLAGLALRLVFDRLTRTWRSKIVSRRIVTVRDKLLALSAGLLWTACHALAFALGSLGVFLLFAWPPLAREIIVGALFAAVVVQLASAVLDFLLAPSASGTAKVAHRFRLVPVSDAAAAHWTRRLGFIVGWFAFGSLTVHLLRTLGFSDPARQLAAYGLGVVILIAGIEAIWNRPPALQAADRQGRVGHLGLRTRNRLWTAYFVALWLLWVAGLMQVFWIAVVVAALPGLIVLTRISVDHLLRNSVSHDGGDVDPEIMDVRDDGSAANDPVLFVPARPGITSVIIERGIRAALIVGAIVLLARVLDVDLTDVTAEDTVALRLTRGVLSAGVILLVIDLLWNVVRVTIDRKLGETEAALETGSERERRRARLRTLLPILKNVLMILFFAVAVMMALSAMGVEIGPLIAGAGVVGVAIGFGAQTVVKDVISGMFYLLDDAFRIGEYISSGSYKGTVESFSLRSVKLRHHRGAIYIVPFSELGAVQNLSRDWVVEKLTVTVGYDTDVDRARKIIKKIGQELLVDPELAPITIEPLKMQGIDSMGESGLILRMKFTTIPGQQFLLKRRALLMINKAFHDNNIKPAFPTVQVAGGERGGDIAAAAQTALAKRHAGSIPNDLGP
ncbi:mechanosensitive ion channel family protein [Rhizobiaceae bacterium CRRU44]|uniref:Mechanosensitive ion channel family protein n=1 Tax=Ferranicluibacter rubi TaxID=2715133 RepID=A0AA43ZJV5_9HYPH|nr:mechanosensitive ion channel domain-containing protein [Ferranicluibacter rubi]NHT77761.1 mechanosensitive ion channel family protein [Ferranicluibacter rubi]